MTGTVSSTFPPNVYYVAYFLSTSFLNKRTMSVILRTWLSASDVAAAMGRSRFTPRKDIIYKYKNDTRHRDFDRSVDVEVENKVDAAEVQKVVKRAREAVSESKNLDVEQKRKIMKGLDDVDKAKRVGEKVEAVAKAVASSVSAKKSDVKEQEKIIKKLGVAKSVETAMVSVANRKMGTVREMGTRVAMEKERGTKIEKDNKLMKRIIRVTLRDTRVVQLKLVGRIDGIENGRVIEIKNRRKRMWRKAWPNEIIQSNVYMFMCDVNEASVIEALGNERHETKLVFDEQLHDEIVACLHEYCEEYFCG